jgi:hypothetical protein
MGLIIKGRKVAPGARPAPGEEIVRVKLAGDAKTPQGRSSLAQGPSHAPLHERRRAAKVAEGLSRAIVIFQDVNCQSSVLVYWRDGFTATGKRNSNLGSLSQLAANAEAAEGQADEHDGGHFSETGKAIWKSQEGIFFTIPNQGTGKFTGSSSGGRMGRFCELGHGPR